MRRLMMATALAVTMLVPGAAAIAEDCPTIEGQGFLDFGRTGQGTVNVIYDGARIRVPFVGTGFVPTGEFTADIFFDFFFPDGVVSVVEHSTVTPVAGPLVTFDSTIEVLNGGTGGWEWSGKTNVAGGHAVIMELSGAVCVGG